MIEKNILDYSSDLTDMGIHNEIVEHPALQAIADVLKYLNLTFAECLPTLIMKADDEFIALVFRGDCRVDFKAIKKEFHIGDLRMATPDEFKQLTNLPIGAARVYIPSINRTLIDSKVLEREYLMGGSGSFSCSIKYKTADLIRLPNSFMADITLSPALNT